MPLVSALRVDISEIPVGGVAGWIELRIVPLLSWRDHSHKLHGSTRVLFAAAVDRRRIAAGHASLFRPAHGKK